MTDSQEGEEEHEGSRSETESPARSPRVSKLPERSHQQPIAALEHDRCSRDCDRRERIPLQLEPRREERWCRPHAHPSRNLPQHATSCQRRHRRPGRTASRATRVKDDLVNLSGKAARPPALAAEDREAQKRRNADGGLMERAMPSDSGEQVDGRLTVRDGGGPVSVGERPR
jgi:hypothetical protein